MDPLVAGGIPKSVCMELPGMEDSASVPAATGDHPGQQVPHSPHTAAHPTTPQEGKDRAQPLQQSFPLFSPSNQPPVPWQREYERPAAIT